MPRTSLSGRWALLLFVGTLLCAGYIAAQQDSSRQPGRTPSARSPSTQAGPRQQNDQLRDQLAQLQMQVKDLQAAIDDLKSKQQATESTVKESRDLLLDSRVMQTQSRQELNSAIKAVGLNERRIDKLDQQVSSMMLDLRRVKTKVGLY